mgnify:CR=1 FL=1
MNEVINTDQAPAPIGPYNQAIRSNNMVFLSGQVALDAITGKMVNSTLEEETNKVLDNITAVLKQANLDFSNIIKTSIFLTNMDDFETVNKIYESRFTNNYPARETVEVSRLPKDARVEISVIAG